MLLHPKTYLTSCLSESPVKGMNVSKLLQPKTHLAYLISSIYCLTVAGNVKGALVSYEKAYETDSTHYTSMLNAAKLLQSQGHTNQSKELVER